MQSKISKVVKYSTKLAITAGILVFVGLFSLAGQDSVVFAQEAKNAACDVIGALTDADCDNAQEVDKEISSVFNPIIRVLSLIAYAVIAVMMVVGAIKYAASGGNQEKTAAAKKTIISALIALALLVSIGFILGAVISSSTEVIDGA